MTISRPRKLSARARPRGNWSARIAQYHPSVMRSALLKILLSVNDPMTCPSRAYQLRMMRRHYRGLPCASQPQPRLTGIQAKARLTWALLLKSEEDGKYE